MKATLFFLLSGILFWHKVPGALGASLVSYDPGIPDSTRILDLLEASDALEATNPDSALWCAQAAWEWIIAQNLMAYRGRVAYRVAYLHFRRGAYDSTRQYLKASFADYLSQPDSAAMAQCTNLYGATHYYQGALDSAVHYFQEVLYLYEALQNQQGIGRALNNLGALNEALGNYAQAIGYQQQAVALKKAVDDQATLSSSYLSLGIIHTKQAQIPLASQYLDSALRQARAVENSRQVASALNSLGSMYYQQAAYTQALHWYQQTLDLHRTEDNRRGMAEVHNNLACVYEKKGALALALAHHTESMHLDEALGNVRGLATSQNHIGALYLQQGDHDLALPYIENALRQFARLPDRMRAADSEQLLGKLHNELGNYDLAIAYYHHALATFDSLGLPVEVAQTQGHLAESYLDQHNFVKAVSQAEQGLPKATAAGNAYEEARLEILMSMAYLGLDQPTLASQHGERGFVLAHSLTDVPLLSRAAEALYQVHKVEGRAAQALEMYELYRALQDSVDFDVLEKQLMALDFEQRAEQDSLQAASLQAVLSGELDSAQVRRRTQAIFFGFMLFFSGGFGLVLYRRFTKTRQQKKVLGTAYDSLSEKNQEVLDSINYARRIQEALLPPEAELKRLLPNSFVFYQPKAIVAGDFYWIRKAGNKTYFAVGDCTGHGVPGAMVSVVCNHSLSRSVKENPVALPGNILDQSRTLVLEEFHDAEAGEIADGMDIALCCLEGDRLCYAGAYNPLWMIRPGTEDIAALQAEYPFAKVTELLGYTFVEIKADRQPIGKWPTSEPFCTHHFMVKPGDTFYLFSDGYADQFGGEHGKKFKAVNFKRLLVSVQKESMADQQTLLAEAFDQWKGHEEQVDDVCVMGVRVG